MCKFNIGDKVRLVSDTEVNVPMTIDGYWKDEFQNKYYIEMGIISEDADEIGLIKCVWRDTNSTPHCEYYHEESLVWV